MKIFVIGFMGVGKTKFGKKLARKINHNFFDLDNLIEKSLNCSIEYIFEEYGENFFREKETIILKEFIESHDNFVLSCGGGTPCFNNNMNFMNEKGITIFLELPAEIIYNRLINAKKKRPLLKNYSGTELLNKISEIFDKRILFYLKANIKHKKRL